MADPTVALQAKAPLPALVLGSKNVSLNVLRFIPLDAAEKYQVCAFELNDEVVKIAIVHPEQLKQGFETAVGDIAHRMGKKVVLYKTDPASFHKLIRQYREATKSSAKVGTLPASADQPKPPLFELGHTVVYNFLRRVPLSYVDKHRLICIDYLAPNRYWFVTDGSNDRQVAELLPAIEEENGIVAHLLKVTPKEFAELRDYYSELEHRRAQAKEGHRPMPAEPKPAELELPPEHTAEPKRDPVAEPPVPLPVDDSVVSAESHASIVSSQEEVGGIAGLFQRVTKGLTSDPVPAAEAVPEPIKEDQKLKALPPMPPAATAKAEQTPAEKADAEFKAATPIAVAGTSESASTPELKADPDNEDIGRLLTKQVETLEELKDIVKKGFIPRIVAAVVSYGIHEKASDIHIEAYEDEVRVRFRIDGQLIDIVKISPEVHASVVSRIKILSRLRLDESRVPQDGRFDVRLGGGQVDLRVSIMPTVHGEKVVLRILDKSKGVVTMEGLGLAGLGYQRLMHAITRPYGICLMTGPTGSGKSTSLYAILQRVSMPNVNIVTLEDPVEYELKGINQSQIKPKIGFTFAEGLRAVLRQDPNIIMVGEIRDGETATMATQAALTGHLVLSTLHTNDAAGAIPRLNNMGIEPFLIASSLDIVVGQRLVRKLCPDCKAEVNLPDSVLESITADLDKIESLNPLDAKRVVKPFKFYQGTGCPKCNGNGYLGRLGIYEVMEISEAIEELTLKHASASDIQAQAQKDGMLTMYQDGLLKAIAGLTSLDEVLRESSNK